MGNWWTALYYARNRFDELVSDIVMYLFETIFKKKSLHIAALYGRLNLCKMLIEKKKFDVNMIDNHGWTALHHAAKNGSYELLMYFTDMGTDINLKTNDGINCLHIAAFYGNSNLCKVLIGKHKFDLHIADNNGWTALHHSVKGGIYELVTYFADMGTDIHLKTNNSGNLLHIAAFAGHLNLCQLLVEKHNFDVNMTEHLGWTALHFSVHNGSDELVTYFIDMGTDINLKTNDGENCLHIAALYENLNLCKMFLEKYKFDLHMTDNEGCTALHKSALSGSCKLFSYFAKMETDINLKINDGKNCLHIAAIKGKLKLCQLLVKKHKFDVNMADYDGWTALHCSVHNGSYELFAYFSDIGTDINLETNNGSNCLHIAALSGKLNICKLLVDKHKFDVNIANYDGWTALHCSVHNGSYELITYLIDMGTDINLKTNDGRNCLHIAALNGYLNLCQLLVEIHNFDGNMAEHNGWTALHCSLNSGSYELVKYFIDIGTDINLKTNHEQNCLHIAASYGLLNICKMLTDMHKFDVNMTNNSGETVLHAAARNDSCQLFKYFADMGTDINLQRNDGRNCLHIAALCGNLNLCKMLLEKYEFDTRVADNDGWTALHTSAIRGSSNLFLYFANMGTDIYLETNDGKNCLHIAALSGDLLLCKFLVEKKKFDVNMTDDYGQATVHASAKSGSYKLLSYFSDIGTDINRKTNDGQNCLHFAAFYGHLNLCKLLLEKHNFDVNLADHNGWTALHCSLHNGSYELVKYFAAIGTDINLKTNKGKNCLHIAALGGHFNLCKMLIEKHKFDVNVADNRGFTAIHFSAISGSYKLVTYITDRGADINLKTKNGKNCLHVAALGGRLNLCKILIEKHNFDVNIADSSGFTTLHFSAKSGSYKLVTCIADRGADINFKTRDGKNCLHIAALGGHLNLCKMLVEKHNFDVNITDNNSCAALHTSVQGGIYQLVLYFADMGTDINLKTKDGKNCLYFAAANGDLNLCKLLVEKHNFDVHMTDKYGSTLLHNSALSGSYKVVSYFADMGTDINLKTSNGENALHFGALGGHLGLCKVLINKYKFDVSLANDDGWTALHFSAQSGSYQLVKYLVDLGTDIKVKTSNGTNCLHCAAIGGHLDLCNMLISKHKFDVSLANDAGWTALHFSAQNGSYELVKYLADLGTDIKLKTNDGKNCLHCAAAGGHLNLCKMLINKHKFDVHMTDEMGFTALHFSIQSGSYELLRYLEDIGTDINLKVNDGRNCLHIAAFYGHLNICKYFVETHKFDVNVSQSNGRKALHCSAENGNFDLFLYILGKSSEIYCKTNSMENILHLSARNGNFDICEFVLRLFVKDYEENNTRNQHKLIGKFYGTEVFYKYNTIFLHAMDNDGNTYLHLAAFGNHANVCELLLKYDTEFITLLNKKDKTARNIAQEKNYKDVLVVLKPEYDRKGMFFRFLFSLYC